MFALKKEGVFAPFIALFFMGIPSGSKGHGPFYCPLFMGVQGFQGAWSHVMSHYSVWGSKGALPPFLVCV